MISQRSIRLAAVALALGSAGAAPTASAVAISDGNYTVNIQVTPLVAGSPGVYDPGVNGNYNSSLSFNSMPGGFTNGMTDNGLTILGFGSGVAGDGVAGTLGMNVSGGNLSFSSFNVDTIFDTPMGSLAQGLGAGGTSLFSGATSASGTQFDLTGRLAAIDSLLPNFVGWKWDYASFTDGTSTNGAQTVNGTAVTAVGDVNGDGLTDYVATFVSAGVVGPEWGIIYPSTYVETWKVQINSVPLPAAVWLLGSGLIGFLGVGRRKKR
jgi:hypothetical protein